MTHNNGYRRDKWKENENEFNIKQTVNNFINCI